MFTTSLGLLMVVLLLRPVVKLLKHGFQFLRDGQSEMRGVLDQGNALIGQVKEDHCGAEHTDAAEHLHVEQMANTDKREDEHLAENTPEADHQQHRR